MLLQGKKDVKCCDGTDREELPQRYTRLKHDGSHTCVCTKTSRDHKTKRAPVLSIYTYVNTTHNLAKAIIGPFRHPYDAQIPIHAGMTSWTASESGPCEYWGILCWPYQSNPNGWMVVTL